MPRLDTHIFNDRDLYTVDTPYTSYKDQTLREVVARLADGRGNEWTVTVQRKPQEFIVTYGGTKQDQGRVWYGWAQGNKVDAEDHLSALLNSGVRNSNHSNGTRYAVTGPERGTIGDEIVTRFFRINIAEDRSEATFSFIWPTTGTTHYKVTEVAL